MLKFYNSWVLFTLALFYFGPIPWSSSANWLVAAVVLTALLAFNMGAAAGRHLPALPAKRFPLLEESNTRWVIATIFLLLSAFHTYSVTGKLIFNPAAYSGDFNLVYKLYQETLKERSTSGLDQALLLLKALMMPAAILLIVTSFKKEASLLLFLLFPLVASSLMRGTDKETVDLMVYMLVLYFYHGLIKRRMLWIIGLAVLVLVLFYARKLSRFEDVNLHCLPGSPSACFDFNNWLSVYISPGLEFMRIMFTNYLTQGYEGMGRALSIPFEFNWGLGQMVPIKLQACKLFDIACQTQTFNDRLPDYGWDTRYKWSSAYTALANDFHWVFLPVYTFCLGTLFSISEKSWNINKDKFSLACLLLITLFIVYSSANMQLTVSLEWTAVYLTLFTWQWLRLLRRR